MKHQFGRIEVPGAFKRVDDLPVSWRAKRIKIGRWVLENVEVLCGQGSYDLNETLKAADDRTRRVRGVQTRYEKPLPVTTPPRLLSIEFADYLTALEGKGIEPAGISAKRHIGRLMLLASGDIPVHLISFEHINQFWEVRRWWPSNAGIHAKYRKMTDAQILATGKKENTPPPATGSEKSVRRHLNAFFNHLIRRKIINDKPMDPQMDPVDDYIPAAARRPFAEEEMATMFSSANFLPWASRMPHFWWGPILGLFTGARVNEVAQLKVADIIDHYGRPSIAFRITVDADLAHKQSRKRSRARLKGKPATRTIPIPQAVLDAGFLDFVADMRATRHARLFPHLSCGISKKTGELNGSGYGRGLSERFSKYLHEVLDLPKGFSFHLFRHTLATSLKIHHIPKPLIASITGHGLTKTAHALEDHYLHDQPAQLVEEQFEAMARFKPPVELPVYKRGQFASQLADPSAFHP